MVFASAKNPYVAPVDGGIRPDPRSRVLRRLAGRRASWTLLAIAALPPAILSYGYFLALRVAIRFDHWPSYKNPDPDTLRDGFAPETSWLMFAGPALVFALCLGAGCLAIRPIKRWPARAAVACGLVIGSWGLSIVFFYLDPFGVLDWIAD